MSTAFAIGAHPDDIEFMMAGTLSMLRKKGFEIHYMNLASGNLGTFDHNSNSIKKIRLEEAQRSAHILGAHFHAPICDDLEIFYEKKTLLKLAAIVREVAPDIVLTHSPYDYAEDHTNTCRLAVSATFARSTPNLTTSPPVEPTLKDCTIYHCLPHTLRNQLRERIFAGSFVNTITVMELKAKALDCHKSQQRWLNNSQSISSYVAEMERISLKVGEESGIFQHAEGWRRHLHHGFGPPNYDPLSVLKEDYLVSEDYEKRLG